MHKIFYNAECPICVREIELIMQDSRAGFMEAVPIQGSEAVLAQYGITTEAALTYLHVLTDDGVMLQEMAAVRKMYDIPERYLSRCPLRPVRKFRRNLHQARRFLNLTRLTADNAK